MAPLLRAHRDQIKATLAWNIEKGIALTGEQIAAARAGRDAIFGRVRSFLRDGRYDVLALPTVQVVPFDVRTEWVREINGVPMATYIDWMRSCSRITVSAHPAVSVPAGLTPAWPDPGRPPRRPSAGRSLRRRPPPPGNRRRRHPLARPQRLPNRHPRNTSLPSTSAIRLARRAEPMSVALCRIEPLLRHVH